MGFTWILRSWYYVENKDSHFLVRTEEETSFLLTYKMALHDWWYCFIDSKMFWYFEQQKIVNNIFVNWLFELHSEGVTETVRKSVNSAVWKELELLNSVSFDR